jgi:hypothetical protein
MQTWHASSGTQQEDSFGGAQERELHGMANNLAHARSTSARLEKELDEAVARLNHMRQHQLTVEREHAQVIQNIFGAKEAVESRLMDSLAERDNLRRQLSERYQNYNTLSLANKMLSVANDELRQKCKAAEQTVQLLQSSSTTIQRDQVGLIAELEAMKKSYTAPEQTQRVVELERANHELVFSVAALEKTLSQMDAQLVLYFAPAPGPYCPLRCSARSSRTRACMRAWPG